MKNNLMSGIVKWVTNLTTQISKFARPVKPSLVIKPEHKKTVPVYELPTVAYDTVVKAAATVEKKRKSVAKGTISKSKIPTKYKAVDTTVKVKKPRAKKV